MTAIYEEVPFSEFLHHPAATAGRLESARALRLRRRDADDLALLRVDQMEQEGKAVEFAAQLLSGLVRLDGGQLLRQVLPEVLPWLKFLPEHDFDAFMAEFVEVARAAAAVDNLAPLSIFITQWRHTAEIYADPFLREQLAKDHEGDGGPVPIPEAPECVRNAETGSRRQQ